MELEIVIRSRVEAAEILSSPHRCADVAFLVSIGDPNDSLPAGYHNVERKLRLIFPDSVDLSGATEQDVERLIAFANDIRLQPGRVLAHCHAGVSRSSAAAYIIYAVVLGAGRELEALERIYTDRPIASPNRRMIEIADRLLRRHGALLRALDDLT